MQNEFGTPATIGYAGDLYGNNPKRIKPCLAAFLAIFYGARLSFTNDAQDSVDMIGTNKVTLTNSGNLGASNVYSFTIKFTNLTTGVETTYSITETYAASDAATMGAVVTQLEDLDEIDDTGTAYSTNVLTIVAADGYIMEVSSEAVNGGSAVTITKANFDTRTRAGFARRWDREPFYNSSGVLSSYYKANDIVGNIMEGTPIIESTTGFDGADSFYFIGYGPNRGKAANAVGNNGIAATDVKSHKPAAASGRGVVHINI